MNSSRHHNITPRLRQGHQNCTEDREKARQRELRYLGAVSPEADRVLQELVDDVRTTFGTELCMINLILEEYQYFRAWSGELPEDLAEARCDPRERSMCQYVVETESPLRVEDFLATEQFEDQYFRIHYGIRFYAGVPLLTSSGNVIGSLCLLDSTPRTFGEDSVSLLSVFARAVVGRIETMGALMRESHRNQELARSGERFRALTEAAFEGVVISQERRVLEVNSAGASMLGYEPDELIGMDVLDLIVSARRDAMRQHIQSGSRRPHEIKVRRKDGSSLEIEVRARDYRYRGQTVRVDAVRDISEQKKLERKLKRWALHDPLTELPNRLLFSSRLTQALERIAQGHSKSTKAAVMLLDLDGFKVVNDTLGHEMGDHLLCAVARRLEGCVRQEDTVARLGGDEFAILLEGTARSHSSRTTDNATDKANVAENYAVRVAEKIVEALRAPFQLGEHKISIAASVGILCSPSHMFSASGSRSATGHEGGMDVEESGVGAKGGENGNGGWIEWVSVSPEILLRRTDLALYEAKKAGKNRHVVFSSEIERRSLHRMELESGLRRAIEREEFFLNYQPVVSLKSGRTVALEALVRWKHPERGVIFPNEFIPLAEETGLIVPIGQWALTEACRQARIFREQTLYETPLRMFVNLSAKQFRQPELIEEVGKALSETGLEPGDLALEITESIMMEDETASQVILSRLKQLGVTLALDDFGTGYSSLAYLKKFPVDILKIHRSMVEGVAENAEDSAIILAITTLARALKLTVVAEGVETAEELEKLRLLGCDLGQGYYWRKPASPEEAAEVLGLVPNRAAP